MTPKTLPFFPSFSVPRKSCLAIGHSAFINNESNTYLQCTKSGPQQVDTANLRLPGLLSAVGLLIVSLPLRLPLWTVILFFNVYGGAKDDTSSSFGFETVDLGQLQSL